MERWIILIILLAVVCVWVITDPQVRWSSVSSKEYGSLSPKKRYQDVLDEFGEPSARDYGEGGGAVWFKKDLAGKPYEMVMILDEAIPHDKPAKHADFLYSWIKLKVPDNKIRNDILGLSKSVAYDPLKQWLQVRCHFMGANKATSVLAIRIATGKLTLDQINKDNMYGKYILRTVKGHPTYDPNAEAEYEKEIMSYVDSL